MPAPLQIKSVNHVGRLTNHLDLSTAFYRNVLGFRPVKRPDFNFPGAWLYNYGVMIHLIHADAVPTTGTTIETRCDHLALHVDDIQAAEKCLQAHHLAYRKNRVANTGLVQIFFHDPDGHHVEIGCYPETPPYTD